MLPQSNAMTWSGRVISGLLALLFIFSAAMKLVASPDVVKPFTEELGYPNETLLYIGIAELASVILYLIPQTAALGAVLLTGYLGGAIATHVRVSDQFAGPAVFGVLVWVALYLRDARIRALLPLRSPPLS